MSKSVQGRMGAECGDEEVHTPVEKLQDLGLNQSDITKLTSAGFHTV